MNRARIVSTDGTTLGPDRVHDVVGVPLQQRGEGEQPVEHRPLLRALQQLDDGQRIALRLPQRAEQLRQPVEAGAAVAA